MDKLDKILEDARKEKESILAELAPLRAEEAKLMEQFQSIDEKLRAVRQKCVGIEKKRGLADVGRTIVRLSRPGSGDKTLKVEPGHYKR